MSPGGMGDFSERKMFQITDFCPCDWGPAEVRGAFVLVVGEAGSSTVMLIQERGGGGGEGMRQGGRGGGRGEKEERERTT
jgi:hypothetical protein